MNARAIIEAEDPKSILRRISAQPYHFEPRRLTPREIERLENILAMGPLSKKPIDDRFLDWGYIEYYGDYSIDDEEYRKAVIAKDGLGKALYDKSGLPREEWMDLPNQYKARRRRRYYWPLRQENRQLSGAWFTRNRRREGSASSYVCYAP